jgi:hypothetical protein
MKLPFAGFGNFKRESRWDENRWRQLSTYNAECSRGIVHTPEWDSRMAEEQKKFNVWITPSQSMFK